MMSSVKDVLITKEAADILKIPPSYLIRLGKKIDQDEDEIREAGVRNYLFSKEAVEKLRKHLKK